MSDYRFHFQITDSHGEVIETDWCMLVDGSIDEYGACSQVDIHVGQMLRNWRNFARAEYEAGMLPEETAETAMVRG